MSQIAKKSLGQHWLVDEQVLGRICSEANLSPHDTVLEIGPGQGALTKYLVKSVKQVIAVELDADLAKNLKKRVRADNLTTVNQDILKFDFSSLPAGYKIVANIPYYLTSHLLRVLTESPNLPGSATILVQKEVAERICAEPGQMSLLGVGVQLYFEARLGQVVLAAAFEPVPKVDSQVVHLSLRPKPIINRQDEKLFFRVAKAGFSARRKKLRSSLSGGLGIDKSLAEELLKGADVDSNLRAQSLSLADWQAVASAYAKIIK